MMAAQGGLSISMSKFFETCRSMSSQILLVLLSDKFCKHTSILAASTYFFLNTARTTLYILLQNDCSKQDAEISPQAHQESM